MRRFLYAILLTVIPFFAHSKNDLTFKPVVDTLNNLFTEAMQARKDVQKDSINIEIIETLKDFLHIPSSFDHAIDTLKHLSCLKSSDNALRIYTWNLCYADGSFKYFGFVQQKDHGKINVYALHDRRNRNPQAHQKDLEYYTTSEWFGCIYYECITNNWNSRTYYTLIGWDGADNLINRKVVEVLSFTKRGIPVFEKKMFKVDRVISSRLIFEYADRATMLLRYNEKHKIIVIDHLSPAEDRFKDMPQYYGPDMSYDALEFKGGRWLLESNINPEIAINYQKNALVNRIKRRGVSYDF
ncbi:MAG: hypothetical protein J6W06_01335 [Bacteroidales bacterium]|nr:hypothetical protein [Bacteroidales bacterium]